MKTSAVRHSSTLSYIIGLTPYDVIPTFDSSTFVPFSKKVDCCYSPPDRHMKKRYFHHKYCGKYFSTSKLNNYVIKKESNKNNSEIAIKNAFFIVDKFDDRKFNWEMRLTIKSLILDFLHEKFQENPDDKSLKSAIKKEDVVFIYTNEAR